MSILNHLTTLVSVCLLSFALESSTFAENFNKGEQLPEKPNQQINLPDEMFFDAMLFGSAAAIELTIKTDQGRDGFPTQHFDSLAHDFIHGKDQRSKETKREKNWRNLSDVLVIGLVGSPIGVSAVKNMDDRSRALLSTAHAFAINNFSTTLLKTTVQRRRPRAYYHDEVNQGQGNAESFPSGHTSNAFTGAMAFFLLTPSWNTGWHVAAFLAASCTGLARVGANKHFFTDVAAGGLIGVSSTWLGFKMWAKDNKNPLVMSWTGNALVLEYRFDH